MLSARVFKIVFHWLFIKFFTKKRKKKQFKMTSSDFSITTSNSEISFNTAIERSVNRKRRSRATDTLVATATALLKLLGVNQTSRNRKSKKDKVRDLCLLFFFFLRHYTWIEQKRRTCRQRRGIFRINTKKTKKLSKFLDRKLLD